LLDISELSFKSSIFLIGKLFKQEVKQLEERRAMKYVTSVERSGIEIGKKEHALR